MDAVVYMYDRETYTRGAYGSYRLKGPHEDQVLVDTLVLDDASIYLIFICGVCKIDNHDLVFTLLQDQHLLRISYLIQSLKLSIRIGLCIHIMKSLTSYLH